MIEKLVREIKAERHFCLNKTKRLLYFKKEFSHEYPLVLSLEDIQFSLSTLIRCT